MSFYPLFADLKGRAVLVVGGGVVAERKVAALLKSGAIVRLCAREVNAGIATWRDNRDVAWCACAYDAALLAGVWLVIAATDDKALNARVASDAGTRNIFVNVVDDAELSTFHVPAVVDRAPLMVAISSGGTAPMLARAVREKIEALLDPALGSLAALLGRYRRAIRAAIPRARVRRRFHAETIEGPVAALLRASRPRAAESALLRSLRGGTNAERGEVVLVGAGPGDPGLLTLHALRALNEADVILHDRLVGAGVLELARRDALRIDIGKRVGARADAQARIHALMLEHARAGKRVVRLKGGDPFVFGRGGEEIEFLHAHGVPYRVVPGITAALACAAYAGVPLTHRDYAQSLQIVTAHSQSSIDALDWPAMAASRQTLAIYMSVGELAAVQQHLLGQGRAADTPFALIENGSLPEQRVIAGTLATLAERAREENIRAPALLIVGEVAALAPTLAWFGRSADDAAALATAA